MPNVGGKNYVSQKSLNNHHKQENKIKKQLLKLLHIYKVRHPRGKVQMALLWPIKTRLSYL